ncbi:adenylyl-sulfate kinase [Arthrobacter zhaoxinii]|uniref:Adenylyl-sulfate kinase n=1 Tax=Arthrobacter zhaoxinii TaxID=2964616 RepID=A0ABY5YPP9_9MICC|nr:adenylyl-sulfate kinase [Arthrobacter zhaoxinii]UWX97061.1 adenylyl-sulfate kinase [Arthrobacter zhaoxinii]
MTTVDQAVFIGGRAGVGKTSVAMALHSLLAERRVRHCVIEGDNLDLAYPEPWEHELAARNLQAMWANYRELGYDRLIYTNTVSVLEMDSLAAAMGTNPVVRGILLTATDRSALERLSLRERGAELERHAARSNAMARILADQAPANVLAVDTDHKDIEQVAGEILLHLGW